MLSLAVLGLGYLDDETVVVFLGCIFLGIRRNVFLSFFLSFFYCIHSWEGVYVIKYVDETEKKNIPLARNSTRLLIQCTRHRCIALT